MSFDNVLMALPQPRPHQAHYPPACLLWLAATQLNSAGVPLSEGVVGASAPVAERSHCGIAPHFGWAEYVRAYVFLSDRELG